MAKKEQQAPEIHLHLDDFVHHTNLPQTTVSQRLDGLLEVIGRAVSWIWVVLMLVIVGNVILRYVFGQGFIELEEIQWHLYSIGFLIALSYCLVHDDHVRVDVLHDRMSLKTQGWIELLGLVIFLLPFAFIVVKDSIPFVVNAYTMHEVSDAPGGLPHRWAIKAVLPIAFALLWVAAFSRLLRVTALLFNFPSAIKIQSKS
jgi:TRAP-type mannitol/chloroaromatic compound transport system permease small subunit